MHGILPGPPAQRFMKSPLSRYIALAQPRTMALMSRRGPLLEDLGWRWTYVIAAAMMLALALALVLWLPSMPAKTRLGYGRLLRSLGEFLRDNATLRRASTIQFLLASLMEASGPRSRP